MMKYDTYKDSGIDWLGKVPEHWRNYRINWIGKLVRGNTGFKKDELLKNGEYVALQYGKTYKVDEVNDSFKYFVNNEFYKRSQIVNSGDTILVSTSETIEDLGHSCFYDRDDLGLLGGEQILLKPNSSFVIEKYLYYYSKKICGELQKYATGLKVFRFNIDDLKQISVAIPLLEEQKAIVQYLDKKTQAIDKKVTFLEKKIDKYKALRKSLINETITKGLNSNVKLKESGIKWIGQIPNHWEVKRLKDLYGIEKNKVGEKSNEYTLLSLTQNGVIIRDIESNEGKFPAEFDTYQVVVPNDLIFCLFDLDVTPRTVGISSNHGMITGAYTIIKNTKEPAINNYFFYLYLMADQSKKLSFMYTGLRSTIKKDRFLAMKIPFPPLEEQTKMTDYLDSKTTTIDNIIVNIKKQIEVLAELRKTLINDVVTGKLKIAQE